MALIALSLAGAGCGQKGPLYLPSTQPDARPATPYPATLPAATDTLDETPQR
ncbi:MAG: lipoprotein [Hydrogenophaga sp.]|nr:lipoprotein [Hydrogenophaga sp.]